VLPGEENGLDTEVAGGESLGHWELEVVLAVAGLKEVGK
jgi:hypothetical protein